MNGNKKNMPSHRLFVVQSYEKDGEEKSRWLEVGVAFPNKNGFSGQLHALPQDGRFVALPYEESGNNSNNNNRA